MSNITDLNVKDDASTRVELVLKGITDTPNPFWRGAIDGVPMNGQPRLTATWDDQKTGMSKISLKLEVPVMETVAEAGNSAGYVAAPKIAHTPVGIFTMFHDANRSTTADRANLLSMMVGLLQGATATAGAGTLDQASSGGAFKGSVAPFPLMFIHGVPPS